MPDDCKPPADATYQVTVIGGEPVCSHEHADAALACAAKSRGVFLRTNPAHAPPCPCKAQHLKVA